MRARQAGGAVRTYVKVWDERIGEDKHTEDAIAHTLEGKEN